MKGEQICFCVELFKYIQLIVPLMFVYIHIEPR